MKLGPDRPAALDLRAELAYRRGEPDDAANFLRRWHAIHPDDPTPPARLGLLEAARGRPADGLALLRQALEHTRGPARVPLTFAAARLALAAGDRAAARALLDECLTFAPAHAPALLLRAALLWADGQFRTLAAQVERLAELTVDDPRANYLVAAAAMVGGDPDLAAARANAAGTADARHLLSLLRLQQDDPTGAAAALALVDDGPAREHAFALRGQLA